MARTGLVLVVGTWAHTPCLHEWGAMSTTYKIYHVYSCLQAVERIRSTPCLGSRARSVVHTALQSCPHKPRGRSYNIFFWRCFLACHLSSLSHLESTIRTAHSESSSYVRQFRGEPATKMACSLLLSPASCGPASACDQHGLLRITCVCFCGEALLQSQYCRGGVPNSFCFVCRSPYKAKFLL